MRGRRIVVALLVLLGAVGPLWAGPFAGVPSGHWSYAACARLVEVGILPAEPETAFSGDPELTRFEFGLALLDPLSGVDAALAALSPETSDQMMVAAAARSLELSPRLSEEEIARATNDLRRLSDEYADILQSLKFDSSLAHRGLTALANRDAVGRWRAETISGAMRAPMLAPVSVSARADDVLRLPLAHGTVAVSYSRDPTAPKLLDYLALSVAGQAALDRDRLASAEPAIRDPLVSRLRTAYEYGLGPALTLSLAYEELDRRGQSETPLDTASLASIGVGYRLTSSTSVKLSYSLLEYSNHIVETPPLRDRVAETAISIEF